MPYNPPGGSNAFFATTHVGPDAAFAAEIPAFNAYLADVCGWMRRGRTCHEPGGLPAGRGQPDARPAAARAAHARGAVLLGAAAGGRPARRPSRTTRSGSRRRPWPGRPGTARGCASGRRSSTRCCSDCRWLDAGALDAVLRLAERGLPVALTGRPGRPGRGADGDYAAKLDALEALPNVRRDLDELGLTPLVEGEELPPYWARVDGDELILFFAHPGAWDVRYPMARGQARSLPAATRPVVIHFRGRPHPVTLDFPPGRSVLLKVAGGRVETIDLREPSAGFR